MTLTEALQAGNYEEVKKLFVRPEFSEELEEISKQYNVDEHDVFDETIRPKRKVTRNTGRKDADGNAITETVWVEVVRVGIPWQKIITERRVGFMLSNPVEIRAIFDTETEKTKRLVAMVEKIQSDNKMQYRNKEILRRKLSECECAVVWYFALSSDGQTKFTLNSKILSPQLGDTLYPMFDAYGTMVAFRRDYKLDNVAHVDIYTPEYEYKLISDNGSLRLDETATGLNAAGEEVIINPVPNVAKKLLIEYYQQSAPVWDDVQTMIARHEMVTSNHGGMNDKFGAPLLTVSGALQSIETDNATGTIMQMENGATAEYLNLASEPASIKLEQENLEKFIYSMSQTPDISFQAMKSIGNVSGIALKLMFTDCHMACRLEEESFGLGIQRRLNIIKHCIGTVIDTTLAAEAKSVQLVPVFTPYLPANTSEEIADLSVAVTSGIMSKETAVEQNPLVEDSIAEMERMMADQTNANAGLQ